MTSPTSLLRREWPTLLALAANAALIAWSWPRQPLQVPVHWNLLGQPDRYGGRFEALVAVPLVLLLPMLLTWALQVNGPARNALLFRVTRFGLALLSLSLTAHAAFGWTPGRSALLGVGLLFTLLGNVMGKAQPNRYVGFRTPWTARSRLAWQRGQRRSGVFLVSVGVLVLLTAAVVPAAALVPWVMPLGFLTLLLGGIGWLVWRSYQDYRADPDPRSPFQNT
ncbi:DUF1648 domain-containing protein [Deinococcus sonorensis]|uniref:DUF1648 domain-containing protein n=2 Tax=Deinococcus sonorensis TaxID=309891 RepID=A0AAU7UAN7_9DEIO